MLSRQFRAACARSAVLIRTRTNFSDSAKVAAVTSGPTPVAVPNTGGEPDGSASAGAGGSVALCAATAPAPSNAVDDTRNSRRDFGMAPPHRIQPGAAAETKAPPPGTAQYSWS